MPATAGWEASADFEISDSTGSRTHMRFTEHQPLPPGCLSMLSIDAEYVTTRW
jgi:hypothetical protein